MLYTFLHTALLFRQPYIHWGNILTLAVLYEWCTRERVCADFRISENTGTIQHKLVVVVVVVVVVAVFQIFTNHEDEFIVYCLT